MPCNSDYLEPNSEEKELQRAAQLLIYIYQKNETKIPGWVQKQADTIYASDKRIVSLLCLELKTMTEEQREAIIYDAKNKTARDLADWWEEHQEADRQRKEREKDEAEIQTLRQSALSKLTPKEKKALGLK